MVYRWLVRIYTFAYTHMYACIYEYFPKYAYGLWGSFRTDGLHHEFFVSEETSIAGLLAHITGLVIGLLCVRVCTCACFCVQKALCWAVSVTET